jgi:ABC-type transport system substrate-binding protein
MRIRSASLVAVVAALCATAAFAQPDPNKVLRVAIPVAETGFDPQAAGDIYSNYVNRVMFDSLYKYDYLARPFKIVPEHGGGDAGHLGGWQDVDDPDPSRHLFRRRSGIQGAAARADRRRLRVFDQAHSRPEDALQRAADGGGPVRRRDAVVAKARETGKFDFDAPMEGLAVVDRYTLRFKLNFADYELMSNLTTSQLVAVAREVVEAYGDASGWIMANPVGTGPYRLKEWRRGQKIVLEANPSFRDERYPEGTTPADRALTEKLAGKRLPLIGRIEISVIEESNPRLFAFEQEQLDYLGVPLDLVANVLDDGKTLKQRFAQRNVRHDRGIQPAISYTAFNMEDPVVGGYTNDKIALRRALAMAYLIDDDIRVIRQGQAVPATQIIPPGMSGHNPKFDGHAKFDPAGARALLDRFGYKDRDGDGFREFPDGRPLTLKYSSPPDSLARQIDELVIRSYGAIGVRVEFVKQKWPDQLKSARLGQLQMWGGANINTTSEGFGFYGLLFGPHAGFSNLARFKLPEYDRLFVQARGMAPGAEREALMQRMSDLVSAYLPWAVTVFRYENVLVQPWIRGFKYSPIQQHPWQYLDIDPTARKSGAP